ncbi:MAG: DUF4255 domain-containing protein [Campylobacterota bacterium]|nr:DUF4255 domain-containing protein [Campylobacterota bacterium]
MIGELLNLVAKEVSRYIDSQIKLPSGKKSVVLHKPNNLKGEIDLPDNSISLSLINIEEELSARDSMVQKQVIDGKVYKQEPAVNVNLQIIFIANFQNDYINELNCITKIIEFFQQKSSFTPSNTKELANFGIDKLIFKLNTLPVEEQHNIWSILGGSYQPSIVYKVGLITIQEEKKLAKESIVTDVSIKTKQK